MHRRFPRKELTRIGVPLVFLTAVTIFVLIVHSGLSGGGTGASSTGSTGTVRTHKTTTTRKTTTRKTTTKRTTTTPAPKYYVIVAGDTFGVIASKEGTTVQKLEALNPGVDSSALAIGQKIRVG